MTDLLFATPWWLLGMLLVIGIVVFWSGNSRSQNGPRLAGVGLILLAVLLKLLSFVFETDKVKVTRQTLELVAAVQNKDWPKFSSLMDDDVSLGTEEGTVFSGRKALVQGAKDDTEHDNLTSVTARVTGVEQDNTGVTIDIDATSVQGASMGYPVPSSWKLEWDRSGSEWRLHQVTCLKIGNESTSGLSHLIK